MRKHNAFRNSGGAGGVRQRNHVVRVDLHSRNVVFVRLRQLREAQATVRRRIGAQNFDAAFLREALNLVHERGLSNYNLSVGGPGLLRDLRRLVQRVGGGADGPAVGGAEEGENELGAVLEEDHDDVALADADVGEAGGNAAGGEVDGGVGVDVAGGSVDEAWAVLELGEAVEAVGVEREVVGDVNVREF